MNLWPTSDKSPVFGDRASTEPMYRIESLFGEQGIVFQFQYRSESLTEYQNFFVVDFVGLYVCLFLSVNCIICKIRKPEGIDGFLVEQIFHGKGFREK